MICTFKYDASVDLWSVGVILHGTVGRTFPGHSCDGFCMQTCEPERERWEGGSVGRKDRGREGGREGEERKGGR